MKNKLNLILIALSAFFIAPACSQNQESRDQNKAAVRQTAANKANDTNGLMQSNTASTQTLSAANENSNTNLNNGNTIR